MWHLNKNRPGQLFEDLFSLFVEIPEIYKKNEMDNLESVPMIPKIPRMLGAKMTSRLMKVSSTKAMAMWRGQLKVLLGNAIC